VCCSPREDFANSVLADYSAHSNYTELALIELGETGIFPHVGRRTMVEVQGRQIYPIVTGTFGGVDFLHSVLGEFSDKAIQSEISQLETTFSDAADQNEQDSNQHSIIKELMDKLNIGGSDDLDSKASELEQKSAAQKQATQHKNSPWGLGNNADDVAKDLYPFLEFHDDIMKKINAALEAIGIEALVEKLSEAVSIFVYSLIGPFILPLLKQAKLELKTGSGEVIASSEAAQHVVFEDDYSSNPTHSMLSKDHFTNLLNEPAGKVASAVLKFVVPLLMQAWDDESIDMRRTCDEIIGGVFHHPAFRNGEDRRPGRECRQIMFRVVEEWWNSFDRCEQDELRERLSRQGVDEGRNHNEGVDSGHGCGKPLQRNNPKNQGGIVEGVGQSVGGVIEDVLTGGNSGGGGGGGFGSMLGGLAGAALGASFGGDLGGKTKEQKSYKETSYDDGQYKEKSYAQERIYGGGDSYGSSREDTQTYAGRTSYGSSVPGGFEEEVSYGSRREESHGGRRGGYRAEVDSYGRGGYNREEEEENYSSSGRGGGYNREEENYSSSGRGGGYNREEEESYSSSGRGGGYNREEEESHSSSGRGGHGSGRREESYTRTGYSENTPSHSRIAERYTSSGGDEYERARERRYEGDAGYTEREYERRGEEENYESRRYGEEGEVLEEKKHHQKKHHKREDYEEEEREEQREEREEEAEENHGRGEGRFGGGGFGGGGYEFENLLEEVVEEGRRW
jgi:hypothetical protein